jgi:hypothetical protein
VWEPRRPAPYHAVPAEDLRADIVVEADPQVQQRHGRVRHAGPGSFAQHTADVRQWRQFDRRRPELSRSAARGDGDRRHGGVFDERVDVDVDAQRRARTPGSQ